jgi:hypothetical protein
MFKKEQVSNNCFECLKYISLNAMTRLGCGVGVLCVHYQLLERNAQVGKADGLCVFRVQRLPKIKVGPVKAGGVLQVKWGWD